MGEFDGLADALLPRLRGICEKLAAEGVRIESIELVPEEELSLLLCPLCETQVKVFLAGMESQDPTIGCSHCRRRFRLSQSPPRH